MTAAAQPTSLVDPDRTRDELQRKVEGLRAELQAWEGATTGEEPRLGRHHTQVAAIACTLRAAATTVEAKWGGERSGPWLLERLGSLHAQVLDLHRMWGFFRAKLALRYVPWLDDALTGVDDIAWVCHAPVRAFVASDRRREPPLVHFAGGTSPFLLPRGSAYAVEPLPDGTMREPRFDEAVRSMPVALIGLPWYQARHLADAPLIAHEVGHAVEHDLVLHETVRHAISAAVPAERQPAWAAWSSEVLADVFGTLACGPAFTRALAALLAVHPRDVATEVLGAGYPPRTVRVLLSAAVVDALEVTPRDEPVAGVWLSTYPQRPDQCFEADAAAVARAVLYASYPGLGTEGLQALLTYTQEDEDAANDLARELVKGRRLFDGTVLQVAAAARLAYDRDRMAYAAKDADAIALRRIADVPTDKIRARGVTTTPPEPDRPARDRRAGQDLAALLAGADDEEAGDALPT